jgi:hypothetical protein
LHRLIDEGEIDEFMIHIIPEFVCEGIPLIAGCATKIESSPKFTDGVVKLHDAVAK